MLAGLHQFICEACRIYSLFTWWWCTHLQVAHV